MSYDDFCRCTPSEFTAAAEAWARNEEILYRSSWEQTRHLMRMLLQPYSSKPVKATDVLVFGWDKEATQPKPVEKSTRARMEEIKARLENGQ